MNISLTPQFQRFIEQQVATGRYDSPDAVVSAGLARLQQEDSFGQFDPGELDSLIAVGEADLQSGNTLTLETLRQHFDKRQGTERAR